MTSPLVSKTLNARFRTGAAQRTFILLRSFGNERTGRGLLREAERALLLIDFCALQFITGSIRAPVMMREPTPVDRAPSGCSTCHRIILTLSPFRSEFFR